MEYKDQKNRLKAYFSRGESEIEEVGMEIEHFVIDKDTLQTVTYQEDDGIETILYELQSKGWQGEKEQESLIKLSSSKADITLEPGGQLEIGINPQQKISELEEIYLSFLEDLIPILEEKGYYLVTLGYQVDSKIDEIDWNPKQRYKIMSNYLGSKGKYAHNMMKGTAALQIALDYKDESDFIHKFRVANSLSPVLGSLLDNAPIFEGEVYDGHALRTLIWSNTDDERTGIVKEAFATDFGYEKYAEYILTREPILLKTNGEYIATDNKVVQELFREKELGIEELEHILTMVFPDVRAKQFIEIRMADSLPPRFSFAVAALWKGLFYNQTSLDKAYQLIQNFNLREILQAREEIIDKGLETTLGNYNMIQLGKKLVTWAKEGLDQGEKEYLKPLEEIILAEKTLASSIKERMQLDKKEAIKGSILNSMI